MLTSLVFLWQGNVKTFEKLIKIVNIKENDLHILWATWGISMKFSVKMWLGCHKKTGLHPLSEKYTFGKP